MSRKNLSADEEEALQGPIMTALAEYFAAAYEPDDKYGSVGSGFDTDDHGYMFIAYRVPRDKMGLVEALIREQADHIQSTIDKNDEG